MCMLVFFFKQKTAYELRISDWSSDVCSSELNSADLPAAGDGARLRPGVVRHPRRGVLADGVAVATGGAVRLFPERSGARLGSERYLYRHASVHGPAIVRRRPADQIGRAHV